MTSHAITFTSGDTTQFHFDASAQDMLSLAPPASSIIITDDNVASLFQTELSPYRVLSFPAGEEHKNMAAIGRLAEQLLAAGANRQTLLLGVGGGVVTDVSGYLAASFMRGLPFAFVPTTLLGQVDAAIGGKNGVNLGMHKNMLGTVRQPRFVLFASSWLSLLPEQHWSAGFAEVIKYGFIADTRILSLLQESSLARFQKQADALGELLKGCVDVKNKIVHADEKEDGIRRILNFGHTAGHAFERLLDLPHGHAVGLGMRVAMRLSEKHAGLGPDAAEQLCSLLAQFGLPTTLEFDEDAVMELLLGDKKRSDAGIDYVLLEKPGVAVIKCLQAVEIREALWVLKAAAEA
jgi:3-dehydroquinate synthase